MVLSRKLGYFRFLKRFLFLRINKVFVISGCCLFLVLHVYYVMKIPLIKLIKAIYKGYTKLSKLNRTKTTLYGLILSLFY